MRRSTSQLPSSVFVPRLKTQAVAIADAGRARTRRAAAAARRHLASAADHRRGAGHRLQTAARVSLDVQARRRGPEPGMCSTTSTPAEEARPCVPGGRVHRRAGHAGQHGGQQLLRQYASPTATWCLAWRASPPGWPTTAGSTSGRWYAGQPKARSPTSCATWRGRGAGDRRPWPTVMRRVACLQPRHLPATRERTAYTADGSVNLAHLLVGAEEHAGADPKPHARPRAAAPAQGAGRGELPRVSTPRWIRRSTSSSWAPARSSWSTAR